MILSETSQHLAGALDRRVRRVELLGTAQPWFAPTVRGLIADLAARADFDLDSIADVRMAVDQACGTLLEHGGPDARLRCVLRWDAQQQGNVFLTFAIPTIQGELRRYFRDRTWSMRVPRRLKEIHVRINHASTPLTQQLGRAPRPSEIAAYLNLPLDEVLDSLQASSAYVAASLDRQLDDSDNDGESLSDRLGHYDPELERVEIHESLKPLLADLPTRERTILIMRFFGHQTQTQIAAQIGLSQMHVSRLLTRTLDQLRRRLPADE